MAEPINISETREDLGKIIRFLGVFQNAERALESAEAAAGAIADKQRTLEQLNADIAERSAALKNLQGESARLSKEVEAKTAMFAEIEDALEAKTKEHQKALKHFEAEAEATRAQIAQELVGYRLVETEAIREDLDTMRRDYAAESTSLAQQIALQEARLKQIREAIQEAAKASAEAAAGL